MITIREIAEKANVSIASVSYALNNRKGVGEVKRKAILGIARELGYVPNSVARSLQSKSTNIIGLVIPDLSNSFSSELVVKLEARARAEGFYLLLGCSGNRFESEQDILERFIGKNLDGIVIVPGNEAFEEHYLQLDTNLARLLIPSVFIGVQYEKMKANSIVLDLENALYQMTMYLIRKRKRNLVFFGGKLNEYYTNIRIRGIKRAFLDEGETFSLKNHIYSGSDYTFQEGYASIRKFLKKEKKLPDAIIGINDMVAVGIIKGLQEQGIDIPGQVSVAGCDHVFLPAINDVKLTTIRLPVDEITNAIVTILLNSKLNVKTLHNYVMQPELIIGNTA